MAERANISTNFIAMIELKHKFPAPETLDRIAVALGVETPELFATPVSPEGAMERLQKVILSDLDRAIEAAVDKAIEKRCKGIKLQPPEQNI